VVSLAKTAVESKRLCAAGMQRWESIRKS